MPFLPVARSDEVPLFSAVPGFRLPPVTRKIVKPLDTLRRTMDSDDDEIYGTSPEAHIKAETKMEDVEDDEEEGEEVESSDDDVNFITDAKEEPKKEEAASHIKRPDSIARTVSDTRARSSTPQPVTKGIKRGSIKEEPGTPDDKPGSDYPPVHVSKIDPSGNPVHPATGKPILATDFDTDFPTESSKPWRKPGADQTDFFNYGFDEFSFASYTLKQQQMPQTVNAIRKENDEMQQFVQQLGNNGMPVPTGPSGGGAAGMPDMNPDQMQQMMQMMMGGGMPNMMMGGDGGMMGQNQPPTGPQGGFQGVYDQGGGGGGGFGGRGRGRGRNRGNW